MAGRTLNEVPGQLSNTQRNLRARFSTNPVWQPLYSLLLVFLLVCLFPNVLDAAQEDIAETKPATIDLARIQEDLDLLKEETVSIAALHEQPISKAHMVK